MEEGPLSAGVGRGAQRLGERLPEMQRKRSRTDALLHAYTVEHLRRDRMSCMRLQPRVSQVVAACMRSTFRTTQLSTILSRARHAGMASTVQSGPLHPYSQRLQPLPSLELSQAHAGPFALPGFASAMLQGRGLAIVQKPRMLTRGYPPSKRSLAGALQGRQKTKGQGVRTLIPLSKVSNFSSPFF